MVNMYCVVIDELCLSSSCVMCVPCLNVSVYSVGGEGVVLSEHSTHGVLSNSQIYSF